MSTIMVRLPDEDLAFLRNFSAAQGTSAEAFLARQARNLREHLQRPLRPEVLRATGIISPDVAGEETHREHLEKKLWVAKTPSRRKQMQSIDAEGDVLDGGSDPAQKE